jgi:rod shape-determining protein MreB
MIARFDPEFQIKIKNNIILSGGGSKIRGIDNYIKDALKEFGDCDVRCVEDPLFVVSDGAMLLAKDIPEKYWAEM